MNRRTMMFKSGANVPRLPSEFQEVEWILASNGAYIDTGISTMNGVVSTFDFSLESTDFQYTRSFVMLNFGGSYGQFFGKNSYSSLLGLNNSTGQFSNALSFYLSRQNLVIAWDEIHTVATLNGSESISHTRASAANHRTLTIGSSVNNVDSILTLPTRFYNFKNTGNANQNFIPCYRKADGVIGMYELITKTFFTNSGSGSFTKGADVN